MRFPRVRFTVRRMMIAVAIVATLVWTALLAIRSLEYRRLALNREEACRVLAGEIASLAEQAERARSRGAPAADLLAGIDDRKKSLAEESRAASVYRERTWRPWRPILYRQP